MRFKEDGVLRGLVCINHFESNDIIPGTENRAIRLKKNAIPISSTDTNFSGQNSDDSKNFDDLIHSNNSIQSTESTQSTESSESSPSGIQEKSSTNQCSECQIAKAELTNLKKDYLKMESGYELQILKLETKLRTLQSKLNDKTKIANSVRRNFQNLKSSKEKLKQALADFKKEDLLCKEVYDFVQVC